MKTQQHSKLPPIILSVVAFIAVLCAAVMWFAHIAHAQEVSVKPRLFMHELVMPLTEAESRMRHNDIGKFPADLEHPDQIIALGRELLLTAPERPIVFIRAYDGETLQGYGMLPENLDARDRCGYPPNFYFVKRIGMSSFWLSNAVEVRSALNGVAQRFPESTTEGRAARVLMRRIDQTVEEMKYDMRVSGWFADEHMVYPPCPRNSLYYPPASDVMPWPKDDQAIASLVRGMLLRDPVSQIVFWSTDTDPDRNTKCFPYWLMHAASRTLTWDLIELSSKADNPDDYAEKIKDSIQPRLLRMNRRAAQLGCLSASVQTGALGEQSQEVHRVLANIGSTSIANITSQMIAQWFLQEAHGNE